MCQNEGKIDFLKDKISQQAIINKMLRHKIYISLIKKCNEQKKEESDNIIEKKETDSNIEKQENYKEEIKSFIKKQYLNSLEFRNVNEFIELLIQLDEEDTNDYLEKLCDNFIIGNSEFYSENYQISIRLFNLIIQKIKPKLKEDNKYLIDNTTPLKKIYNDIIEEKDIKYEHLEKFSKVDKKIILEKIFILSYVSSRDK